MCVFCAGLSTLISGKEPGQRSILVFPYLVQADSQVARQLDKTGKYKVIGGCVLKNFVSQPIKNVLFQLFMILIEGVIPNQIFAWTPHPNLTY